MDKSNANDLAFEWHLLYAALGKRDVWYSSNQGAKPIVAAILHLSDEVSLLRLTLEQYIDQQETPAKEAVFLSGADG